MKHSDPSERNLFRRTVSAVFFLCLVMALTFLPTACGGSQEGASLGVAAYAEMEALLKAHPSRDAGQGSLDAAHWIAARLRDGSSGKDASVPQLIPVPGGPGPMANVLYTPAGVRPVAVLVSHFDTKSGIPGFVGANDGGSTTGLLLALAKHRPNLPVIYLFVDGEECVNTYTSGDGLHGSWHAARTGVGGQLPVIVLDMLGDRGFTPALAANGSPWLNGVIRRAAARTGLTLGDAGVMVDDHVPFVACGRRTADIIDFSFGPENAWWHTSEDTADKVSAESLAKAAALVIETVRLLEKEAQ